MTCFTVAKHSIDPTNNALTLNVKGLLFLCKRNNINFWVPKDAVYHWPLYLSNKPKLLDRENIDNFRDINSYINNF